jgi:hypothetical protein
MSTTAKTEKEDGKDVRNVMITGTLVKAFANNEVHLRGSELLTFCTKTRKEVGRNGSVVDFAPTCIHLSLLLAPAIKFNGPKVPVAPKIQSNKALKLLER